MGRASLITQEEVEDLMWKHKIETQMEEFMNLTWQEKMSRASNRMDEKINAILRMMGIKKTIQEAMAEEEHIHDSMSSVTIESQELSMDDFQKMENNIIHSPFKVGNNEYVMTKQEFNDGVLEFENNYTEQDDLTVNENTQGLDLDMKDSCRVLVVDQNSGGDSLTVQGAVDLVPEQNHFRHKIYILPGIYKEKVHVPKSKPYVSFIGAEIGTFGSVSVTVDSDYFGAREVTFENSVVSMPGTTDMQAVALRLRGDKAWLYKGCVLHSVAVEFEFTGRVLLGRAWGNNSKVAKVECRVFEKSTQIEKEKSMLLEQHKKTNKSWVEDVTGFKGGTIPFLTCLLSSKRMVHSVTRDLVCNGDFQGFGVQWKLHILNSLTEEYLSKGCNGNTTKVRMRELEVKQDTSWVVKVTAFRGGTIPTY